MKHKPFKIAIVLLLFVGTIFAQKTDKKFSEQFYTNKDVAIEINASNAEIDVQTWNKNEVAVEATIQVEGLSKDEAEKYLNNWKFEALGNKKKVKINANSNSFHNFGKGNFVHFNSDENHFPVVIPELPEMPDMSLIEIPDIDEEVIIFSDEHLKNAFKDLDALEFDFDKYSEDGNYFFQWKDDAHNIEIKSKKEWEEFKKTKEYKKLKKRMKETQEKLKKSFEKSKKSRIKSLKSREESRKKMKEAMEKARIALKKVDRAEINKAIAEAQKSIHNSNYSYIFSGDKNDFTINGKKVKITKKITIKVPKGAMFDLNTRHCKVKLPNAKVSGRVNYGSFNANSVIGGKLNISYSPVLIEQLTACTLFLNNVTDAKIASVTNTTLNTNSSGVIIENINENVDLTNKFGELTVNNIIKNYKTFKLLLNYSDAKINLSNISEKLSFDIGNKSPYYPNKSAMKYSTSNSEKEINGNFVIVSSNKNIDITGKYSQLTIKQ